MFPITVPLSDLSSAANTYVNPGLNCRLVTAYTALTTAITTGDSTITLSDGTTTIGVVTITQSGCAVNDIDEMAPYDSDGSACSSTGKDPVGVKLGPGKNLKIANDAVPGAGAANITLVFDEFHGA